MKFHNTHHTNVQYLQFFELCNAYLQTKTVKRGLKTVGFPHIANQICKLKNQYQMWKNHDILEKL